MLATTEKRIVVALNDQGRGIVLEESTPKLRGGEVLVRVMATMISPGTQLNGVRAIRCGEASGPQTPRPLGYQAAGEVIRVGDNVQHLTAGQRVACFGPGALHTNLAVVPQNLCAPIPDNVTDEEASGMNLVLTAMQALRRTPVQMGEFLLVVGMGTVGQLTAQFGRASGLYVMGWDMSAGRLGTAAEHSADAVADPMASDLAERCRAFTEGLGFDAAVMAIGGDGTAALEQVKAMMKVTPDGHAMGHITLVGGLSTTSRWGAGMGNLDLHSSARSGPGYHDSRWELGDIEYPPVFVRWTTQTHLRLALRMMGDSRLHVAPLISHRFPLEQIEQAIELLTEHPDQALAVVLTP
jgi:NADPH:quinone reductase-like Zn-dependent oxidoreductase